ncbi:hypothetical protein MRB53_006573 [Persea americana]|uniref:Uncharacterized protein n=1 Tax=Persea americana TaxID=3435 RepID=A0ACC2MHB8_PERAE|nr:hypothetical protein MRB53_006573 [Persea americana]
MLLQLPCAGSHWLATADGTQKTHPLQSSFIHAHPLTKTSGIEGIGGILRDGRGNFVKAFASGPSYAPPSISKKCSWKEIPSSFGTTSTMKEGCLGNLCQSGGN